ncbi:MAG: hypothetical protein M3Q69_14435 [Acidobacteriota bacterium]|nr:hypothetical protein [Acidobacteriota bacterium]
MTIERGSVFVYRMFDVAEAIDLKGLEANARASRLRIARPGGQALIIKNAPLSIALGEHDVALGERTHRCDVQARLWDYGVISVQYRVPIAAGTTWTELVGIAAAIETTHVFEEAAKKRLQELMRDIHSAIRAPHHWDGTEDYVIYFLEEMRGVDNASSLPQQVDVAALLLGEATLPLSDRTRRSIAESTYQYWAHDLAVIDWNSALVVEPSGVRDVADVIEFALTHLMELRYYDDLLDERLGHLYAAISQSERTLFRTNYARLSREASALFSTSPSSSNGSRTRSK